MKKKPAAKDFENRPITRGDIDAGRLIPRKRGTNGAVLPAKQRVNITLDSAVVEHLALGDLLSVNRPQVNAAEMEIVFTAMT